MDYLHYFMQEHLELHFKMEEEFLFIYLAKNDLLRKEAEKQHEALRSLHRKIVSSPTAKILQALARQGIISSAKGPNGGFYIEKEQEKLTLLELVEVIDGDQIFEGCGLGLKICSEVNPCPIHNQFKSIRDQLKAMLWTTSIKDLAAVLKKGTVFLNRSN